MKIEAQEIADWRNHPLTKNFEGGVNDAIKHFKEQLSSPDTYMDIDEINRKKGIILGLEALLTYEPEVDADGELVEHE